MARIRYLKPEFFEDEHLAELPFEARLFFAGLWNFADKAGRLQDRPARLKIKIFPYDKVDVEKCLELLSKLKNGTSRPFIQRYQVEGEAYIQILSWEKHQKPHFTEKESIIPPAPHIDYNIIINKDTNTTVTEKIKGSNKGMGSIHQATLTTNNVETTVKNLCISVINDLNEVMGSSYRVDSKTTLSLITNRVNDGFTLDDFKAVHRNMFRRWSPDNKMREFLRPITLYSNKFESYLNIKQDLPLSTAGAKTLMAGKEWMAKKEAIDVGQAEVR